MIARVAEQCFWMSRYLERVENTARLLLVNGGFLLDADIPALTKWEPVLTVAGELEDFEARHGADLTDDGETVQRYLVWDDDSPVSMRYSLRWARENARTVRDVISLEHWLELNGFWLWFDDRAARRLYATDRDAFYEEVRDSCQQISGIAIETMLHEEPFDFMRLGSMLERAGQTARILDIKYHALGPTTGVERPEEAAHWLAILRSCTASEAFFKRTTAPPSGPAVAEFLLFEPSFPRSVMHCVTRAWHFLRRIRAPADERFGHHTANLLQGLLRSLRTGDVDRLLQRGLHAELSRIISRLSEITDALRGDYFVVGKSLGGAAS